MPLVSIPSRAVKAVNSRLTTGRARSALYIGAAASKAACLFGAHYAIEQKNNAPQKAKEKRWQDKGEYAELEAKRRYEEAAETSTTPETSHETQPRSRKRPLYRKP